MNKGAILGGSLVWLGAAIYGVGIGGWATLYYFASDPAALDPATAARLIDHVVPGRGGDDVRAEHAGGSGDE